MGLLDLRQQSRLSVLRRRASREKAVPVPEVDLGEPAISATSHKITYKRGEIEGLRLEDVPSGCIVNQQAVTGFGTAGARWPEECVESARRFGQSHARLFPLIGKRVLTPDGVGILVQATAKAVGVALDTSAQTVTFVSPDEVVPWEKSETDWAMPSR